MLRQHGKYKWRIGNKEGESEAQFASSGGRVTGLQSDQMEEYTDLIILGWQELNQKTSDGSLSKYDHKYSEQLKKVVHPLNEGLQIGKLALFDASVYRVNKQVS